MPDIKAESAGTMTTPLGYDGTDFQNLHVDADGDLQVDALTSPLPPDAATETTLASVYTVLQIIDNLVAALLSVGTDKLIVTVDGSTLPTGAATAANQATEITHLANIANLRAALDSVGSDELRVNVMSSELPIGAATAANQATMITALQLIDDLRNALGSVNTDDLQVDVKTSALPSGAATEATLDTLGDHVAVDPDSRYVGDNIINQFGSSSVNDGTWYDAVDYTVPASKKLYVIACGASVFNSPAKAYSMLLDVNGTDVLGSDSVDASIVITGTCLAKATAGQHVKVQTYHKVGAAAYLKGWFVGYLENA